MRGDVLQDGGGIKPSMQNQGRTQGRGNRGVQISDGVEHRRWQRGDFTGLERDAGQDAANRSQRGRCVPGGTLRGSGRAAGEDDHRRAFGGLGRGIGAAAGDQLGKGLISAAGGFVARDERPQFAQHRFGQCDRLGVLIVVDDQLGALALRDVSDLRSGELGVQHDRACPDPGAGIVGDREPAVVAGENAHTVAAAHAHGQQPISHRVDRVIEFGIGDRALVVDDRQPVRGAAGVERRNHPDLSPAPDIGDHGGQVVRGLDPEGAGRDHLLQVVQLRRSAFGDLAGFVERAGGEVGDQRHNPTVGERHPRDGLIALPLS